MPHRISPEEFEEHVDAALDSLPDEILSKVRNVVLRIEDYPPDGQHILGLFQGVPLPERQFNHVGHLPDTITIYREPLMDYTHSAEELQEQIRVTVLHEVGHYFGMSEEDLHRKGYG